MLVAFGYMNTVAKEVRDRLKKDGYFVTFINLRFASPIDFDTIESLVSKHRIIVTMEDNVYAGGIGQAIAAELKLRNSNINNICISLPDKFIEHGKREFLLKKYGLDVDGVYEKIINVMNK